MTKETKVMCTEVWKDVKNYEGIYQVSNLGNIRSLDRKSFRRGSPCILKGRKLNPSKNSQNYVTTALWKNQKKKGVKIHRLVAEAFLPNPHNKRCVNHKDGNRSNNKLSNLEWVTHSENTKHAYKTKLKVAAGPNVNGKYQGENHPSAKLKESDVIFIRKNSRKNGGTYTNKRLSEKFNMASSTISEIINRNKWSHIK